MQLFMIIITYRKLWSILGFTEIPRPPFDCEGHWLYGYGLSLHLVKTTSPAARKDVKIRRIDHFSSALPRVDHIAFVTSDVDLVKRVLDDARVFYKEDIPAETYRMVWYAMEWYDTIWYAVVWYGRIRYATLRYDTQ